MKYLFTVLIFFIVLFIYIHIQYQIKTSNDLEVYTIETPTKDKFEEICDIRQPVKIALNLQGVLNSCNIANLDDEYGAFDVKIRNIENEKDNTTEKHLPLLLKEVVALFQKDSDKKLITEKNYDFLEETGAVKHYQYNDEFLRPSMVSKCNYDFWSGSIGSHTPLRYENSYRNYLYVTSGKIRIKLIPPNYSRYLNVRKDYENSEYISPVNPWNIAPEHQSEFNKVKVLDIELNDGELLYIPAYWLYSIKYETISSISVFSYRTYMNTIAIMPDLFMQFLQQQNITHKIFSNVDEINIENFDKKL